MYPKHLNCKLVAPTSSYVQYNTKMDPDEFLFLTMFHQEMRRDVFWGGQLNPDNALERESHTRTASRSRRARRSSSRASPASGSAGGRYNNVYLSIASEASFRAAPFSSASVRLSGSVSTGTDSTFKASSNNLFSLGNMVRGSSINPAATIALSNN